jgi:hypothetical protein
MAGDGFFDQFLGSGSIFEQLFIWSVASAAVQASLTPFLEAYLQRVNAAHPEMVLDPPTLADAVIRNYMSQADAAVEAAKSGLDADRFATMIPLHGDAPGPQQLVEAYLRGIIPGTGTGPGAASFEQGILEGRLGDKWIDMMRQLGQVVISPPDAASAVVRNFLDAQDGAAEAAKSGVDAALFDIYRHLAADAPGPQQLAEALRRQLIPETGTGPDAVSFDQGIAEGRLGNKWTEMIKGLSPIWPTPADALRATLNGQVTQAEGLALYEKLGGDPQFFQVMFDTEGNAPTPEEAVLMAMRGIIPWAGTGPDATTYQQAFLEGPWRNKWADAFQQVAYPIPTEGEITEFLRYGIIDSPAAAKYLAARGITGDYAQNVLDYAEAVSTYDFRGLTMTSVMNALSASLISVPVATQILQSMHMSDTAISLLIGYAQVQKSLTQIQAAISHVGNLYTAHKITADTARASLGQLGLDSDTATEIMQVWDLEAAVTVTTLTAAQIADAWYYDIFDQDTAIGELTNIGYTPYDAWVYLSVKNKAPLPGQPAQGPPPSLGTVIPGTT